MSETGAPIPQPPPSATILVVHDTPGHVKLLEALLSGIGYRVITAANGQEALDLTGAQTPDLILLDDVMPVMDGYETCRRLRADPTTRDLPVVMITAGGEQERPKAIERGADDVVIKPFNRVELLSRVKSLLRIKLCFDYAAIGNVTNLAARLCAEAQPGQILISQRVYGTIGDLVRVEHVGDVTLKGLPNPVATYNVTGLME